MKKKYSLLFLILLSSCIGTDIIPDFVGARVQINQEITALGLGENHQFQANFTNDVGETIQETVVWKSSNPSIMSIGETTGLATGVAEGNVEVMASVSHDGTNLSDTINIEVSSSGTVAASNERTTMLQGFRSYRLSGDAKLIDNGNGTLTLSFADNYSFSGAPDAVVYLTNNPNSVDGALLISELPQNSGAFELSISGAGLNQYSHVLFWCRAFSVKLGDGEFSN